MSKMIIPVFIILSAWLYGAALAGQYVGRLLAQALPF
jgi:hypothetical protein